MKVKLLYPEVLMQYLVSRMQNFYQSLPVSLGKCLGNNRILGHHVGKAHGHVFFELDGSQKILIFIRQALLFVVVNQIGLEMIRDQKQSRGPHQGEKKERNNELPLKTDIV